MVSSNFRHILLVPPCMYSNHFMPEIIWSCFPTLNQTTSLYQLKKPMQFIRSDAVWQRLLYTYPREHRVKHEFFAYCTSSHNLVFSVRKTAIYWVIGKLWDDAASYGDLLWFQKIEAIPVDFPDFLESRNRLLEFFEHKWERKGNTKAK